MRFYRRIISTKSAVLLKKLSSNWQATFGSYAKWTRHHKEYKPPTKFWYSSVTRFTHHALAYVSHRQYAHYRTYVMMQLTIRQICGYCTHTSLSLWHGVPPHSILLRSHSLFVKYKCPENMDKFSISYYTCSVHIIVRNLLDSTTSLEIWYNTYHYQNEHNTTNYILIYAIAIS